MFAKGSMFAVPEYTQSAESPWDRKARLEGADARAAALAEKRAATTAKAAATKAARKAAGAYEGQAAARAFRKYTKVVIRDADRYVDYDFDIDELEAHLLDFAQQLTANPLIQIHQWEPIRAAECIDWDSEFEELIVYDMLADSANASCLSWTSPHDLIITDCEGHQTSIRILP